ncbi:MAG: hypothetical protein V1899_10260, partial [Planctomycetota bacterium]
PILFPRCGKFHRHPQPGNNCSFVAKVPGNATWKYIGASGSITATADDNAIIEWHYHFENLTTAASFDVTTEASICEQTLTVAGEYNVSLVIALSDMHLASSGGE